MDYFHLPVASAVEDPVGAKAALKRAWNACAQVPCPKCYVAKGQYCHNGPRGSWRVTRFHRPRQDDAGVPSILGPVGIHGLSWAKGKGSFPWDDRRIPTV